MKANRKTKDSVFSLYLTEDPRRLVEAYNAMQETDYPLDTPMEINTLQDALYKDRINDISFLLDGRYIVLLEHQSTINENMPLRLLLYVARLYEKIFSGENVYRKKRIRLPNPEFFVLYNGDEPYPQESFLRLSEAFAENMVHKNSMEVVVKVLNIRSPENNPTLQKSRSLWEYSIFVDLVHKYKKNGMTLEDTIHNAVLECKERGIMQPFLTKHASEVENMLLTDWNWDDALRVQREEGRQEGRQEGHQEGRNEGITALVSTLQELSFSKLEIIKRVVEKFSLSQADAEKKVNQYWNS